MLFNILYLGLKVNMQCEQFMRVVWKQYQAEVRAGSRETIEAV